MQSLFYVSPSGYTDDKLNLYDGRHGDWLINIGATGVTTEMVDWQIVGLMFCHNMETGNHRTVGLVWDESRVLTDYDGVGMLTREEKDALDSAGFNLYNFLAGGVPAVDWSSIADEEDALNLAPFDEVSFIMEYEEGALSDADMIQGFQHMLDTGLVWQLQGSYQRTATALLDAGLIHRRGRWAD